MLDLVLPKFVPINTSHTPVIARQALYCIKGIKVIIESLAVKNIVVMKM